MSKLRIEACIKLFLPCNNTSIKKYDNDNFLIGYKNRFHNQELTLHPNLNYLPEHEFLLFPHHAVP